MSEPLLTACLIVRDEAADIESCLASVRPFVDEIVVGDTGSEDDTLALARAAGARAFRVDWIDDFAAARNAVLEVALAESSSPWVLSLDADERVAGDPAELRALLQRTATDANAASAFNVVIQQASVENPRGLMRHLGTKVFQPGIARWKGRVHERPVYRHGARTGTDLAGTAMPEETLVLTHLGYASEGAFERRARRNTRLAELELADLVAAGAPSGDIARVRLDLGRSLISQLDPARGRVILGEVRAETSAGEPTWLWASDFLAWDAVRYGDAERARGLWVELQEAGAPGDYLLNLAAAVADTFGDVAMGERLRGQITRRVSVTGHPG